MITTPASPLPAIAAHPSLVGRLEAWPALLAPTLLYLPTIGHYWNAPTMLGTW